MSLYQWIIFDGRSWVLKHPLSRVEGLRGRASTLAWWERTWAGWSPPLWWWRIVFRELLKWTMNTRGWQADFMLWEHRGERFWEWPKAHDFEFYLASSATGPFCVKCVPETLSGKLGSSSLDWGGEGCDAGSVPLYSQPHGKGPSLFPSYLHSKDSVVSATGSSVFCHYKDNFLESYLWALTKSKNICLEFKVQINKKVRSPVG